MTYDQWKLDNPYYMTAEEEQRVIEKNLSEQQKPPAALIELIERPLRKIGPNDKAWHCSYCHRIVDHWKTQCPRCLRTKEEAR